MFISYEYITDKETKDSVTCHLNLNHVIMLEDQGNQLFITLSTGNYVVIVKELISQSDWGKILSSVSCIS